MSAPDSTARPNDPVPLILLGGGGHAAVVCDAVDPARWALLGYLGAVETSPAPSFAPHGDPIALHRLGTPDELVDLLRSWSEGTMLHAAVGDGECRRAWMERAPSSRWTAIVAPSAVVSPSAHVGSGAFVGPRAVINARARIGAGAIVNTAAVVEHDCTVGSFAHVAPGAVLGGGARVGDGAVVGLGARVLPGVALGRESVLGAGGAAIEDIPDHSVAIGVPARPRHA